MPNIFSILLENFCIHPSEISDISLHLFLAVILWQSFYVLVYFNFLLLIPLWILNQDIWCFNVSTWTRDNTEHLIKMELQGVDHPTIWNKTKLGKLNLKITTKMTFKRTEPNTPWVSKAKNLKEQRSPDIKKWAFPPKYMV